MTEKDAREVWKKQQAYRDMEDVRVFDILEPSRREIEERFDLPPGTLDRYKSRKELEIVCCVLDSIKKKLEEAGFQYSGGEVYRTIEPYLERIVDYGSKGRSKLFPPDNPLVPLEALERGEDEIKFIQEELAKQALSKIMNLKEKKEKKEGRDVARLDPEIDDASSWLQKMYEKEF